MTADYPTGTAPATPEYVLAVLRDWNRIASGFGEAVPLDVTYDTPFREWEDSLEVDDWGRGGFAGAMNAEWGTDIPAEEWDELRSGGRTVGDLCRLVASRATRPVIRPWSHVGGSCLPAGAFLTVRALFASLGEEPARITPSSELAPYLSRHSGPVWQLFARLAPGFGPIPNQPRYARLLGCCLVPLGFVVLVTAWGTGVQGLYAAGALLIGTALALDRLTVFWRFPDPAIRTFRDLAYCLAGQEPRRRIQPTQ